MRFTSISAFVFLRFFVPALLNPKLFGLTYSHPDPKCQRTLTLIAKTLQGLANMSKFGGKEPWMANMNTFVEANTSAFVDYIAYLCSPSPESRPQWTSPTYSHYSVPLATRSTLGGLAREGVPRLPHLIDQAKDLSILVAILGRSQGKSEGRIGNVPRQRRSESSERLFEVCRDIRRLTLSRARAAIQLSYAPSIPGVAATPKNLTPRERIGIARRTSSRPAATSSWESERPTTPTSTPRPFTPATSPSQSSVQISGAGGSSSSRRTYRSYTISNPKKPGGMLRRASSSDRVSTEFGFQAPTSASHVNRARADTDASNFRPPISARVATEPTFTELESIRPPFTPNRAMITIPVSQTITTTYSKLEGTTTGDGDYGTYPLSDDETAPDHVAPVDMSASVSIGAMKREGGIFRKLRR
jgi:hypothetical protein